MSNFWAFFQLHPISDDVEDLAIKLFSATLHGNARRWYDSLPDASITSMDQLEDIFLGKWSIKEYVYSLLNELNNIKKNENETVNEFHIRFKRLLQRIPEESNPGERYLIFLYTREFSGELGFLLNDRETRTIQKSYHIAIEIETNISSQWKNISLLYKSRLITIKIPQILLVWRD